MYFSFDRSLWTQFSCLVLLIFVAIPIANATHVADHRYTMKGVVLDDSRVPRSAVEVAVAIDGKQMDKTMTDLNGAFTFVLHLHDQDLGRMLTVRVGTTKVFHEVYFLPANTKGYRGGEVSFVGDKGFNGPVPAPGSTGGDWKIGLGILGLVVFGLGLFFLRRRTPAVAAA